MKKKMVRCVECIFAGKPKIEYSPDYSMYLVVMPCRILRVDVGQVSMCRKGERSYDSKK